MKTLPQRFREFSTASSAPTNTTHALVTVQWAFSVFVSGITVVVLVGVSVVSWADISVVGLVSISVLDQTGISAGVSEVVSAVNSGRHLGWLPGCRLAFLRSSQMELELMQVDTGNESNG